MFSLVIPAAEWGEVRGLQGVQPPDRAKAGGVRREGRVRLPRLLDLGCFVADQINISGGLLLGCIEAKFCL